MDADFRRTAVLSCHPEHALRGIFVLDSATRSPIKYPSVVALLRDDKIEKTYGLGDIAGFGAEEKIFKQNSADIRKEYAHVPKLLFEAGRKKMLHEFLQMSPIYKTAPFRETYEAAAKANLQQATSAAIVRVSKKNM